MNFALSANRLCVVLALYAGLICANRTNKRASNCIIISAFNETTPTMTQAQWIRLCFPMLHTVCIPSLSNAFLCSVLVLACVPGSCTRRNDEEHPLTRPYTVLICQRFPHTQKHLTAAHRAQLATHNQLAPYKRRSKL